MKKKILPALVLGLMLHSAATLADGDIYVGGPWGTRINRLPYTITAPGTYYLGSNLSYADTGDGITIASGVNHVTLDLMGFTINGSNSGRYCIFMNGSKNVEIRNGTVTGWDIGINEVGSGKLHRIINVREVGNNRGIYLTGSGHLIKGCEITNRGSFTAITIGHSIVSGCTVIMENGPGVGIDAGIISDNVVSGTGVIDLYDGIRAYGGGLLIKGNKVTGCAYGINGNSSGLNVIGNTVNTASGTTGISLADEYSNLLDQNTVTGAGTHFNIDLANTKVSQRSNY